MKTLSVLLTISFCCSFLSKAEVPTTDTKTQFKFDKDIDKFGTIVYQFNPPRLPLPLTTNGKIADLSGINQFLESQGLLAISKPADKVERSQFYWLEYPFGELRIQRVGTSHEGTETLFRLILIPHDDPMHHSNAK